MQDGKPHKNLVNGYYLQIEYLNPLIFFIAKHYGLGDGWAVYDAITGIPVMTAYASSRINAGELALRSFMSDGKTLEYFVKLVQEFGVVENLPELKIYGDE